MATVQECARCVASLFETKSVIRQRNYRTHLNKSPPRDALIRYWQWRFPNSVTSMIFREVLGQLRVMMLWSDFKNHLQEALKINTKTFARIGSSTCYRAYSAVWKGEVKCVQNSTCATVVTWWPHKASAFRRRDGRSQWPRCRRGYILCLR